MNNMDSGIFSENGRRFDYPLKGVDVQRWKRLGELALEEAAFVIAGFEPPPIRVILFNSGPYFERPGKTWAQPPEYNDFVRAAKSASERQLLPSRWATRDENYVQLVELSAILSWARDSGFTVAHDWEGVERDVQPAPTVQIPEQVLDNQNCHTGAKTPTPAPEVNTATPASQAVNATPSTEDDAAEPPKRKVKNHTTPALAAKDSLNGTATVWTPERKDAARTMLNDLRGQGKKAFSAITALHFGVTPTRLREVLKERPNKAPAKKPKGVWDV